VAAKRRPSARLGVSQNLHFGSITSKTKAPDQLNYTGEPGLFGPRTRR